MCASDPKHPWDGPFYPWSSFLLGARPWPSKRTTQGMPMIVSRVSSVDPALCRVYFFRLRSSERQGHSPNPSGHGLVQNLILIILSAGVAELVDATDLKSVGACAPWGFESPLRHFCISDLIDRWNWRSDSLRRGMDEDPSPDRIKRNCAGVHG